MHTITSDQASSGQRNGTGTSGLAEVPSARPTPRLPRAKKTSHPPWTK